jgi:hypothetical protein
MRLHFIIDKKYDQQFSQGKKALVKLDETYRINQRYMKYSKKEYQKSWDEIGEEFSEYIERVTGCPWFYQTYRCVISATLPGVSNWGHAPVIMRGWKENPYTQRRITAHELILSHYFEIYRHHFQDTNLKDEQVWALAEIAALALTSLTDNATKFWPWDIKGYYTDHDYPQIVELQLKLKPIFLRRKNFTDYMKKGLSLVSAYKDVHP